MKRFLVATLFTCSIGLLSANAHAAIGNNAAQLKLKLMQTTQVVAVANFSGPPDKFVPDTDSNTLQIVFLGQPEFGPSRVSGDGEVIFLAPGVTEDEQSNLIGKAFDIRVQRLSSGQK